MIIIKNPYAEQKRDLLVSCKGDPDEKQKAQLEELEQKSREFVEQKLRELGNKVETVREQKLEAPKGYPSISKQYKEMCRLYRECYSLLLDIRSNKKELREELTRGKTK